MAIGPYRFAAAAVVARDRSIGNEPLASTHQFQHGGVQLIDVLAQIQLSGLVDKSTLIGDVHRNWLLQLIGLLDWGRCYSLSDQKF
jgi:hypothetical protein